MAKLLHIFYHKEGTFSLLCQQVQLFTHSYAQQPLLYFYSVTFSHAMKMKSRKPSYSAALYILYISSS